MVPRMSSDGPLQDLRDQVRMARPVRDRGDPDQHRARRGRIDAERRLEVEVAGEGSAGSPLAVIGVPPVDAVIPLGRGPGVGGDGAAGRRRQGREAEDLLVIARALEGGDPGRHDRAVDDITQ